MNIAGLSLDQTPPLSVPASYFVTAPLFAVAAGVLALFVPELLTNRWLPQTLAATHLLTLGFLAMAMIGALQQLLPVLAGAPVPHPRLIAHGVYIPFVSGVGLLVFGLATETGWAMRAASVLLGTALAIFLGIGAICLSRARAKSHSVKAMRAALAAFAVTAGLGLHLASGHGWGVRLAREFTDLHALWGLAGWVALLVMGVAYQVVPMFQITPDYPARVVKYLAPAVLGALVIWSAIALAFPGWAPWAGLAVGAGLATFAIITLRLQHRRRRRLPDVTLNFWRMGMASLLLAVAVWGLSAAMQRPQPEILLGILFIVGFGISVVNGMLYKIVPFLVWLHLNNKIFMAADLRGRVPNMKQVIPEARARRQFHLHWAALIFLIGAAITGETFVARAAGGLFALSAGVLAFNLFSALRLYRGVLLGTGVELERKAEWARAGKN